MSDISANAISAVNAVTGYAGSMTAVPEIENDPDAVRKLAVAVFHLADALQAAEREIQELRAAVSELQGSEAGKKARGLRPW